MVYLIVKSQMGASGFEKFTRKEANRIKLLRAERTTRDLFLAKKNGTIITAKKEASDYPVPEQLVDVIKYGNLIISEYYDENKFDANVILAEKSWEFPIVKEEYNEENFLSIPKDKKEVPQQLHSLNLDEYEPMDTEEWNAFWSSVNRECGRNPLIFKSFTKEAMLLSNLGGIKLADNSGIAVLNENINNCWELAFLLGYKTEIFEDKDLSERLAKGDLKVKSYLHPYAKEIFSGN